MSQLADILNIVRRSRAKFDITEEQCVELFIEIMGACEWDILETYEADKWQEAELLQAKEMLFPAVVV